MRKTPLLALTGLLGAGLITVPVSATVSADDNPAYLKRDDHVSDLVLVSDDDDDDTGDDTGDDTAGTTDGNTGTNTGAGTRSGRGGANTDDNTRSNYTAVSRDRDLSRGDKTRDWTRDGSGSRHRDHSANRTNDRSRNDSRR